MPEDVLSPEQILHLDESGADALLDRLERTVPVHPPFVRIATTSLREAIVFGDTHGDWRSALEVERRFSAGGVPRLLVGLGDYVDRSPPTAGRVRSLRPCISCRSQPDLPDRVYLIQGNHETTRRIPVVPHDLPEEVDALWGPESTRCTRIEALLERGPLAAVLPDGVYLAHAGFPLVGSSEELGPRVREDRRGTARARSCGRCAIRRGSGGRASRPGAGATWSASSAPPVSASSFGGTTRTSPGGRSTTVAASRCTRPGCTSDSGASSWSAVRWRRSNRPRPAHRAPRDRRADVRTRRSTRRATRHRTACARRSRTASGCDGSRTSRAARG